MSNSFNILDLGNPFPFYTWARQNQPIFFDEPSGYWVLTKYKDIKEVIINEDGFSAELERVNYSKFTPEVISILQPIHFEELFGLSTTENPVHDRVKRVLMPAFHELFAANLKPQIEAIIEGYMERVADKKEFDICSEIFYTLPADIIFTILGISKDELKNVKDWSASRLALTWGTKENQLENAHNIVKYWNFCKDLVTDRVANPRNDLPSRLVAYYHKGEISLHEIQLLCYGLVFSGHATTSAFMTESFRLLQATGKWQDIIENNIPFSQVADELLRLCPSAFTRRRLALQDIEVGDRTFKKGDQLLLVIGSGNRDEDFFENPDDLDFTRKNASKHLAFGSGFHYCIGARLVKFEFALVMEQIAKNFPQIKLSTNNDFSYAKNISIRALEKLNVLI